MTATQTHEDYRAAAEEARAELAAAWMARRHSRGVQLAPEADSSAQRLEVRFPVLAPDASQGDLALEAVSTLREHVIELGLSAVSTPKTRIDHAARELVASVNVQSHPDAPDAARQAVEDREVTRCPNCRVTLRAVTPIDTEEA